MDVAIRKCTAPFYPRFRVAPKTFRNHVLPRFRCVAHLWVASYTAMKIDRGDDPFPCHPENLARFLADADFYRLAAEAARTRQSPTTVLRAQEMVRLPPGLSIAPRDLKIGSLES